MPQIGYELISGNYEFRAYVTGSADDDTVTAVLSLHEVAVAWVERDGALYFTLISGVRWSDVRENVTDAVKRAKNWPDDVDVYGV